MPIKYPQAIWDEDDQAWTSDAVVAETRYTAPWICTCVRVNTTDRTMCPSLAPAGTS